MATVDGRNRWLLTALVVVLASCTGFYETRPGELYRDRQPAEDELARDIERYDLQTIVLLRGLSEDTKPSRRAAWAADIDFVHIQISAQRLPSPEKLLQLWATIDQAKRPILFHCRAGVDRTGLAMALALLHDTGDLEQARGQLVLLPYGHVGIGTGAMTEVLDLYEPWHGRMDFPEWVREVYTRQYAGEDVPHPAGP